MAQNPSDLNEHAAAIIGGLVTLMGLLVSLVGWFMKRTLGKLEHLVEDLVTVVQRHQIILAKIIFAHKNNHDEDLSEPKD